MQIALFPVELWYTNVMLDHHIQRSIVYKLSFIHSARFSDLQPDDVENKLFTYHLKKVLNEGYIIKSADGLYALTPEGRRLSTGVLEDHQALVVERPLSTLFLVIRRKSDNAWLLYRRGTHPMLGYEGFMYSPPSYLVDTQQAAEEQCLARTGLKGTFTALGGGYIRIYHKDQLESFTHFTLLYCNDIEGELLQNNSHAEYFWSQEPDFTSEHMFPSSPMLRQFYEDKNPFFTEMTFSI
jgi:hypothetical protein